MKLPLMLSHAIFLPAALAASLVFLEAKPAGAVTIVPSTVLPGAISFEYFGLNFADNIVTSNAVGTLDYSGGPGCAGACIATTSLGVSPAVSAKVNEVVFDGTSGGVVQAKLGYYVEYVNAEGVYDVTLHATDGLSAPDGAFVSAGLIFGEAGTNPTSFNNFSSVLFQEGDCINGCPAPGFVVPAGPFVPAQSLKMTANIPYYIQLEVLLNPQPTLVQISGLIDPTFTTDAPGGRFIFSPGIGLAAPEPATWILLLAGFAGLAGAAKWRAARAHSPAN
jgi:PEP-CTERM motif